MFDFVRDECLSVVAVSKPEVGEGETEEEVGDEGESEEEMDHFDAEDMDSENY